MLDRFYLRYVYNNKIYDVFAVDFFNKTAQLVSLDRAETLFTKVDTDKLFQCTGLKDKNDKLIYEGDIIRVQYIGAQIPLFSHQFSNLPEDEIFSIIYDYDWHKFCCKNPNYKKACEIHSLDLNAIQINTENKQYEIIGNIYENPELLQGDNNV